MKENHLGEELSKKKGHPDFTIMIITFILLGIGLVMVYSSSQVMAYLEYNDTTHYLRRQALWAVIGLVAMVVMMNIPYIYLRKIIPLVLAGLFVMMVLVLTPQFGVEQYGAQRWLNLGFIVIQPSEFVKLGLILYLALLYSKKQAYIDQFVHGLIPPLVVVGLFFGLILVQNDLGTAMSIVFMTLVILFCAGARLRHMIGLGLMAGVLFVVFAVAQPYRLQRLTSFVDPWADPQGDGYQLIHSLFAIGNGGLTGSGLGNSVQKYMYLPEAHTDFIFAVIAEELGLLGVVVIILLFVALILRGIKVSMDAPDMFGTLLGVGIISMIGVQTFINLGVVSGILPITGLTVPFISYGGSSLLLTLVSMGILLNVSRYVTASTADQHNNHIKNKRDKKKGDPRWEKREPKTFNNSTRY